MYTLVRTSTACPEQYDVYVGIQKVGYLRLRHGHFTAQLDGPDGEQVYTASPEGDGIFEHQERDRYLREALAAIATRGSIQYEIEEIE